MDITEEKNLRKGELPRKYMVKILCGWDNEKFEKEVILVSMTVTNCHMSQKDIKGSRIMLFYMLIVYNIYNLYNRLRLV